MLRLVLVLSLSLEACGAANAVSGWVLCPVLGLSLTACQTAGPFDAAAEARACQARFNVTPDRDWSIISYGMSPSCLDMRYECQPTLIIVCWRFWQEPACDA